MYIPSEGKNVPLAKMAPVWAFAILTEPDPAKFSYP
jgi:hypothetical protein